MKSTDDVYMRSLPCAYARKCPHYECCDDLHSYTKRFRVSYGDKKYEPEIKRYGIENRDSMYKLYEDAQKKMIESSEHQTRMDNIDAFYMIFGTPMGGDVGTKEFCDMCWQFIEGFHPGTMRGIQK